MVAQPEMHDLAFTGINSNPEVGFALSVPTPEMRGGIRTHIFNYGVYVFAALTLFAVLIIASGKSGIPHEDYAQVALLFCPVTMAVVLGGLRTMRISLRNERVVQERFFSTVRARTNLSPMEYTDILQKPDTLFLTDGETITLWKIDYSDESITIRRVRPSEA